MGISSKFVNFIEQVYLETRSIIWTGEDYSEDFETFSGVKQGCLMSPLLFALYLNDLHEDLGGGLKVDDLSIRLLLYADDIVILADEINTLQNMINNLEAYCEKWNMEVNLAKSAIMVFRRGGKLAEKEKWQYKRENIIITNTYCYLGVVLTPKMVFQKHLDKRNNAAMSSLNFTWNNFFEKKEIKLGVKWKMFQSVCRAVQSYAAQVWGYCMFENVDKLQLQFIKKIFKLPSCSPTYAIYLETGIECGHIYTLALHLNYIQKTISAYEALRLPRLLTKIVLKRNVFWAKVLNQIGLAYNLKWDETVLEKSKWAEKSEIFLNCINTTNRQKMWNRALSSTDRIYKELDHSVGKSYFKDDIEKFKISWIFKARSNCIVLNGLYNKNCSLCNLNEKETIQHFLGRCPILKQYRCTFFGKTVLSDTEIVHVLNGVNDFQWKKLINFITGALKYRQFIIDE